MSKTIGRNRTKAIETIFATVKTCTVYTLANCFTGQPALADRARKDVESGHGKLTDNGDGKYTVHIHSNCWYVLSTK